uniref:COesterase domain-containing protein n=1 Tax=Angiostrongylus cantonensis TaxID=6313 RepID=A0A0K0D6N6_ANGCA
SVYLLSLLIPPIQICYEVRSVNTAWGVVRGERVHPNGGDLPPVTQFLGVPYGVAPSGQFRFNMAISSAKWTHLPKEARKLSPACIQTQLPELSETRAFKQMSAQRFDYVHRLLPKLKLQSEDCLYMNIFVPERLGGLQNFYRMMHAGGALQYTRVRWFVFCTMCSPILSFCRGRQIDQSCLTLSLDASETYQKSFHRPNKRSITTTIQP